MRGPLDRLKIRAMTRRCSGVCADPEPHSHHLTRFGLYVLGRRVDRLNRASGMHLDYHQRRHVLHILAGGFLRNTLSAS